MSVLARHELDQSPLADLHALAAELGIESFRGKRREALIDAILEAQGGEPETPTVGVGSAEPEGEAEVAPGEGEAAAAGEFEADPDDEDDDSDEEDSDDEDESVDEDEREEPAGRGRRPRREAAAEEEVRSGTLDVLPNGSGFMRVDPFVHSRDDVYVSPAQIRRCELRAGDELSGPVRPPRRSERYPSLVRVDTVNGSPAEPPEERPRFEELTPVFASERLPVPERVSATPFGKGSRVAVGGPPGAGATTLLREIAESLSGADVEVTLLLAGVRPEEVTEWRRAADGATVAGGGFDRPAEELAQVAAMAVERAKRAVERGRHAALIVDSLDALPPAVARKVFGAARASEEAGTLTVVASTGLAGELQRVATTRIVLEAGGKLAAQSGTLRPELLG